MKTVAPKLLLMKFTSKNNHSTNQSLECSQHCHIVKTPDSNECKQIQTAVDRSMQLQSNMTIKMQHAVIQNMQLY